MHYTGGLSCCDYSSGLSWGDNTGGLSYCRLNTIWLKCWDNSWQKVRRLWWASFWSWGRWSWGRWSWGRWSWNRTLHWGMARWLKIRTAEKYKEFSCYGSIKVVCELEAIRADKYMCFLYHVDHGVMSQWTNKQGYFGILPKTCGPSSDLFNF